jgi:hypothetical protein
MSKDYLRYTLYKSSGAFDDLLASARNFLTKLRAADEVVDVPNSLKLLFYVLRTDVEPSLAHALMLASLAAGDVEQTKVEL